MIIGGTATRRLDGDDYRHLITKKADKKEQKICYKQWLRRSRKERRITGEKDKQERRTVTAREHIKKV